MSTDKKLVSVVVPIYNEVQMLDEIYQRVDDVFKGLEKYDYELVFFDDGSTDGTREAIESLAEEHSRVKAVFYSKNCGYLKNTFYSMQQAKGDCAFILHADLQNPPEVIPQFIEKWEKGAQVVLGVKSKSHENKLLYFLRTVFYYIIIYVFGVKIHLHATEFELFDRSFVDILKKIKTNTPFLRGMILEYAGKIDKVYYVQDARKVGKSKFNLKKYYEFAMCGIVQYSVNIPRRCVLVSILGMLAQAVEFFVFFLPGVQELSAMDISNGILLRVIVLLLLFMLIFMSLVAEFLIFTIKNSGEKPLVVEEKRVNY